MIYASKTGGFHVTLLKTSDLARLIPKEDNSFFFNEWILLKGG